MGAHAERFQQQQLRRQDATVRCRSPRHPEGRARISRATHHLTRLPFRAAHTSVCAHYNFAFAGSWKRRDAALRANVTQNMYRTPYAMRSERFAGKEPMSARV